MTIEIDDDARTLTVEGIKFSVVAICSALNNPPSNVLFSIRRAEDQLEFSQYHDLEAAAQFFEKKA